MSKKIGFIPFLYDQQDKTLDKYLETPKPVKKFIPNWYRDQELLMVDNKNYGGNNLSFKACVPFLDSLSMGYCLTTHQDITVLKINNGKDLDVRWNVGPVPIVFRESTQSLPIPAGHLPIHCAWFSNFGFMLPKGYSLLVTHPLNRFDLPFTTVSGIIDDEMPWAGQFSFWWKDNFEGIIPKDTPFAQLIPFKREDWISERRDDLKDYAEEKSHSRGRIAYGFYKKYMHKKKSFK